MALKIMLTISFIIVRGLLLQFVNVVCHHSIAGIMAWRFSFACWYFQTREILRLNGVYKKILASAKVEMYEGEGKVLDAHTVALTTPDGEVKHFTAKHILIATGGRAVLLDIPGKVGDSKETGFCFYVMCVPCAKFLWLRLMVCLHHLQ